MDTTTRQSDSATGEEVFVGRERELAAFRAGLQRRGHTFEPFLLVDGEPGIGRTRLCSELVAVSRATGARVLAGRCRADAPEYGPWREVIAEYVSTADPADLGRDLGASAPLVAQLVPELAPRLGRAAFAPAPSVFLTETGRFALFDAVARFFERVARARPLVLVFDDLHDADVPSLLLLHYLARNSRHAAITIAATYCGFELRSRPEAAAILEELALAARTSTLKGLSVAEVARLLEVEEVSARPAAVRAFLRRSGGNPAYLRALIDSPGRDFWLALDGEDEMPGALPETVRESVERRLAALSAACRRALQVASAIGIEFDLGGIARSLDTEVETMRKSLDEAVAAGLVRPAEPTSDVFSFAHGVTREALRDELRRLRRTSLPPRVETTGARDAAERPPRTTGCFLLDGRYWTIKYEGSMVRLRDSAGMRCIAHLLLYQDEALHVRNLARFARVARAGAWGREGDFTDQQVEMAVVERVKGALELIADFHPTLGRHLKASLRTGLFCAYLPEPGQLVSWLL